MSNVTNVILATGLSEDVEYLTRKFKEFKWDKGTLDLKSIEDKSLPNGWYGGDKLLEVNLFIGAFNNLSLEKVINYLRREILWNSPEEIQLIIREQYELKFRIIDLG